MHVHVFPYRTILTLSSLHCGALLIRSTRYIDIYIYTMRYVRSQFSVESVTLGSRCDRTRKRVRFFFCFFFSFVCLLFLTENYTWSTANLRRTLSYTNPEILKEIYMNTPNRYRPPVVLLSIRNTGRDTDGPFHVAKYSCVTTGHRIRFIFIENRQCVIVIIKNSVFTIHSAYRFLQGSSGPPQ